MSKHDEEVPDGERPLVTNASNIKQVRQARKTSKQKRESELADLRDILNAPQGRRFLWRLQNFCGTFESVFRSDEPLMAHLTGRQDVGHFLFSEIMEADPKAFLQMMREHNSKTL